VDKTGKGFDGLLFPNEKETVRVSPKKIAPRGEKRGVKVQ